jgi:hypothetical protein
MLDGSGGSGMKIALQFSRSCARDRVPEVLIITLIYIIGFAFIYASPAITLTSVPRHTPRIEYSVQNILIWTCVTPSGGTSTLPSYSIANHRQTLIRSGFGHQILTVTSKPKYWTNNKRHHDRWIASVNGSLVGIMKHSIYYGIILHILWYLGYIPPPSFKDWLILQEFFSRLLLRGVSLCGLFSRRVWWVSL